MKIREVGLLTHQIEAIKDFYGKLLELELVEDGTTFVSFRAGNSVLSFKKAPEQEKPYYHVAFTIPTNKLADAKRWAQDRNIPLLSIDGEDEFYFPYWDATAIYFYDPSGNLMEFIAHHSLDNAVNEAFEAKHLLCISEIGLPVDDVPDTISKMNGLYHLEPFAGDGKQFSPIGDAEGMFIVIDKEMPWFPDGRKPGVFATEAKVETGRTGNISLQNGLYSIDSI
ncbi:VOC family protein [Paenibacillus sp. ClWae2A]|uniref:VOC family protein n=1 Tax=Paenibacillus sp. ClWae2A TaxID=3057177 RepID=UPI0028F53041|nr:VOC family protein [Paenibacillus sp. ClWae2A]MDT9723312.1 VOC family protein [Paenibacillus sp. ClWae2A]